MHNNIKKKPLKLMSAKIKLCTELKKLNLTPKIKKIKNIKKLAKFFSQK
jgi:hypothetical protein